MDNRLSPVPDTGEFTNLPPAPSNIRVMHEDEEEGVLSRVVASVASVPAPLVGTSNPSPVAPVKVTPQPGPFTTNGIENTAAVKPEDVIHASPQTQRNPLHSSKTAASSASRQGSPGTTRRTSSPVVTSKLAQDGQVHAENGNAVYSPTSRAMVPSTAAPAAIEAGAVVSLPRLNLPPTNEEIPLPQDDITIPLLVGNSSSVQPQNEANPIQLPSEHASTQPMEYTRALPVGEIAASVQPMGSFAMTAQAYRSVPANQILSGSRTTPSSSAQIQAPSTQNAITEHTMFIQDTPPVQPQTEKSSVQANFYLPSNSSTPPNPYAQSLNYSQPNAPPGNDNAQFLLPYPAAVQPRESPKTDRARAPIHTAATALPAPPNHPAVPPQPLKVVTGSQDFSSIFQLPPPSGSQGSLSRKPVANAMELALSPTLRRLTNAIFGMGNSSDDEEQPQANSIYGRKEAIRQIKESESNNKFPAAIKSQEVLQGSDGKNNVSVQGDTSPSDQGSKEDLESEFEYYSYSSDSGPETEPAIEDFDYYSSEDDSEDETIHYSPRTTRKPDREPEAKLNAAAFIREDASLMSEVVERRPSNSPYLSSTQKAATVNSKTRRRSATVSGSSSVAPTPILNTHRPSVQLSPFLEDIKDLEEGGSKQSIREKGGKMLRSKSKSARELDDKGSAILNTTAAAAASNDVLATGSGGIVVNGEGSSGFSVKRKGLRSRAGSLSLGVKPLGMVNEGTPSIRKSTTILTQTEYQPVNESGRPYSRTSRNMERNRSSVSAEQSSRMVSAPPLEINLYPEGMSAQSSRNQQIPDWQAMENRSSSLLSPKRSIRPPSQREGGRRRGLNVPKNTSSALDDPPPYASMQAVQARPQQSSSSQRNAPPLSQAQQAAAAAAQQQPRTSNRSGHSSRPSRSHRDPNVETPLMPESAGFEKVDVTGSSADSAEAREARRERRRQREAAAQQSNRLRSGGSRKEAEVEKDNQPKALQDPQIRKQLMKMKVSARPGARRPS